MEFGANDYGYFVQCQSNKSWISNHESLEQFKSECWKGLPLKKRRVMNFMRDDIMCQFHCVYKETNQEMNHGYYESMKHLPFRKRFISRSITFVAPQHSNEYDQRFSIDEAQHWNAQTTETDQEPLDLTTRTLKGASEKGPKRRPRIKSDTSDSSGSTVGTYSCCVCHKQFDNAKKHKDHQHRHLKKVSNAYRCNICGKTYGQKSSLNGHMRHHTNERPYKCRYCDRAFTDQSTFTKHERVHTKEKPYVCKVCSWAFTQSGNLIRHERIHEENRQTRRRKSRAKRMR